MRYLRYGDAGSEKPGCLDAMGRIRDLSEVIKDLGGDVLCALPDVKPEQLSMVEGSPRLGPPVASVGKMIGIGLNYSDHAEELGMPFPSEPIMFLKATSSICGPHDPIRLPRDAQKADWEAELAVVIGKPAKYVDVKQALDHVAGYTIGNDLSERGYQMDRGGQWTKGKIPDTFGPLGPWLVTADEFGNPQDVMLHLEVNGVTKQHGSSEKMIFSVAEIISYLSQMLTLETGDVILTGTPPGVGMGMTPPEFLQVGDVVSVSIDGLGQQRNEVTRDA